jgi:hypothetical protein
MRPLVFKRYPLLGLAAAVTMAISNLSVVAQDTPVNSGPNAIHPQGGSPWNMRLQIALLYPKIPKKK